MTDTLPTACWRSYESATSARVTTYLRDQARALGLPTDYSRIGDLTVVAVRCTPGQWDTLLVMAGIHEERVSLTPAGLAQLTRAGSLLATPSTQEEAQA